jgi:hypothetical protein
MPARWVDLGWTTGPWLATFGRRFGLPRILDSYEREFITCAGIGGVSSWSLNGESIGSWSADMSSVEFEVTGRLLQRNLLEVRIDSGSDQGGLWGEVALEIRGTHFLRDVAIVGEKLTGHVVGEAEAPLELYILCNGKTVRYENVTASPVGSAFAFDLPCDRTQLPSMTPSATWRIELVEGANRWFTVDLPIG